MVNRVGRFAVGGAAALVMAGGVLAAAPASASVGEVARQDDVGVQYAPCGSSRPPNRDGSAFVRATTSAAHARNGSSTSCASNGVIYRGDRLDFYCYTNETPGVSWTYVSAFERGVAGWVRDDLLPNNGSRVLC